MTDKLTPAMLRASAETAERTLAECRDKTIDECAAVAFKCSHEKPYPYRDGREDAGNEIRALKTKEPRDG